METSQPTSMALPAAAIPRRRAAADAPVRYAAWIVFAVVLIALPLLWPSGTAQTVMSQIGIAIVGCLAYNILLGQGGMLSFGHAVYSGFGAFLTIHTLNAVATAKLALPVSLVPIVGGLAGLGFAALLGFVTTRKSGTPFAMITLGVGELVWSMSLMLPEFFGGEGGVAGNRVVGTPVAGISFGPQIQMYYLIAAYCFAATVLMYALTRTPLGRMLNAVRDNPERVEFIGYSTNQVRYITFMISGFFMGLAGGLGALNFEIVTAEVLGVQRSGAYLLFVFLGGAGHFHGPIIGAVLMVLALVLLSEVTRAWLLYLGIVFVLMVMYLPGGIAGAIDAQRALLKRVGAAVVWRTQSVVVAAALPLVVGLGAVIEMIYHRQFDAALDPKVKVLGLAIDTALMMNWIIAVTLLVIGALVFDVARRAALREWAAAGGAATKEA